MLRVPGCAWHSNESGVGPVILSVQCLLIGAPCILMHLLVGQLDPALPCVLDQPVPLQFLPYCGGLLARFLSCFFSNFACFSSRFLMSCVNLFVSIIRCVSVTASFVMIWTHHFLLHPSLIIYLLPLHHNPSSLSYLLCTLLITRTSVLGWCHVITHTSFSLTCLSPASLISYSLLGLVS